MIEDFHVFRLHTRYIVAKGFEAGIIEVGIGGVNTGVVGSDDNNALVFKLSQTKPLPNSEEGEYIIDGISGTAAFSVFYQTDGELSVAYAKGGKDISEGITIEDGENELVFNFGDDEIHVDFPSGDYSAQEVVSRINSKLEEGGYPLKSELDNGNLKIRKLFHIGFQRLRCGKTVLFHKRSGYGRDGNPHSV